MTVLYGLMVGLMVQVQELYVAPIRKRSNAAAANRNGQHTQKPQTQKGRFHRMGRQKSTIGFEPMTC